MGDTTGLVAVGLVEDAEVEHPVVDDQEEDRPLDERPVETLDALLDERRLVVEVAQREEIAGGDEEQWHVELEDELAEPARGLGVGDHHQDDGNTLADRDDGVAFHEAKAQK